MVKLSPRIPLKDTMLFLKHAVIHEYEKNVAKQELVEV